MTRSKKQSRRIATEVIENRIIDYIELKNGSLRPQPRSSSFLRADEELFLGHVDGPHSELNHFDRFIKTELGRVHHDKIPWDDISYKTKASPIGSTYYNFSPCTGH